jgi:glycosyltransferase involved in cell wall biosynthesis
METGEVPRDQLSHIGVVAIGRNEGERLGRCLSSLPLSIGKVVYVDSGSVDDSVAIAERAGAEVVPLDLSSPFTAARARNTGIARLLELSPDVRFVFVIDGDCELRPGFLEAALAAALLDPRLAVVCGRRRERHPEASVYDQLCDLEWDTPVGFAEACGGDALLRVSAFCESGGYDDSLIAGEEPELCVRLRQRGFSVLRIDREMTLHEAGIRTFAQWWRRSVRAGHGYAEVFALHRYWGREVASVLAYGVFVPLAVLLTALSTSGKGLALLLIYFVLYFRVKRDRVLKGEGPDEAGLYARFCVIAKFAHLVGMGQYAKNRVLGRRAAIIEYKGTASGDRRSRVKPVAT